MTKSAQDFARELTTIVDASANALTTLNRVLEQQQQTILALASEGDVPAPSAAGPMASLHPAAAPAPAPQSAPAVEATSKTASPTTASPEHLLAQAERIAETLIHHAPEVALAHVYQAAAHAVSLALLNTVSAQQQLNIVAQAVVTRGAANQFSGPGLPAMTRTDKGTGPDHGQDGPGKRAR